MKKLSCLLLALLMLLTVCPIGVVAEAADSTTTGATSGGTGSSGGYREYREQYANAQKSDVTVNVALNGALKADGTAPEFVENKDGSMTAVKVPDGEKFTVTLNVPKEGLYQVKVDYKTFEGKDIDMICGLYIDGKLPFASAMGMTLSRVWKDSTESSFKDEQGNEYRPIQLEEYTWTHSYLCAKDDYVDGGYQFYFSAGEHTLTFESVQEGVIVGAITLCQELTVPTYEAYLAALKAEGKTPAKLDVLPLNIQAEDAAFKSHPVLYSIADYSSCLTTPHDKRLSLQNTIGGESWTTKGQWIEWSVDVETAGFYQLVYRYKQNFKSGSFSVRQLRIDGEIPFAEAEAITFNYSLDWNVGILGGEENPAYLYLDEGKHSLRLEVVYGPFAELCSEVQSCLDELNILYRKIMMITGAAPDTLRDYNIGILVPECEELCGTLGRRIAAATEALVAMTGERGSETALLDKLSTQLLEFEEDVEQIPERFATFNSNISGLATWLMNITKQPVLFDYLELAPIGTELPPAEAPWYESVWNEVARFFFSFVDDYDNIAPPIETTEEPVNLWLSIGRDQAIVMQSIITSGFTDSTGIPVNLRLIDLGVLMRAVAANQGPDLALYQGQGTIINYAMRNALQDFYDLEDVGVTRAEVDEVLKRFPSESYVPFKFQGALYALPENINYNVLFYRTDIMEELGFGENPVPETWDDVYKMLAVFQKNKLEFGVASSFTTASNSAISPIFLSLLFQHKGTVYDETGHFCTLDEPQAVDAFEEFCNLYTKHGLSLKTDLLTRFRTGEIPMLMNNFTFANELSITAPEIDGLWKMAILPGVRGEDGTVNHATQLSCSGTVMFSNARNKKNTWELIQWWTSDDAQTEYARQIESALTRASRWTSANLVAMESIAWSREEMAVIKEQLSHAVALPEVAGGYYTGRSVNNALRSVVNSNLPVKETLYEFVKDINEELALKRKELGLE